MLDDFRDRPEQRLADDTAKQLRTVLEQPRDRGELKYVSVSERCEWWEVEYQGAVVTILIHDDGGIAEAHEWRNGVAVQLTVAQAEPILEAAVAHREALEEQED